MKKWENLSRFSAKLIHLCKNYYLHWIGGRANIISKYIIYIFFDFGCGFCGSFPILFPKAAAFCCKKLWTNFCCIVLLYLWAQKVSQIFKIVSQTGDINIFALCGVFFIRYVQLKSSFLDEEKTAVKSETYFSREGVEN